MDFSQRSGLKTSVKNDIIGSGFGEQGGTPHQEFPGEPPPPPLLSGIILFLPLHALKSEYGNAFFVFVQV